MLSRSVREGVLLAIGDCACEDVRCEDVSV